VLSIVFQGGVYLYLDQYLFAPQSAFQVTAAEATVGGKAYYSKDRKYKAVVMADKVEIYAAPGKSMIRSVATKGQKVTYFQWLDDRNLALMALQQDTADTSMVELTAVDPTREGYEVSAKIEKLPRASKIVDVAFSTATNVIYMEVQVGSNPEVYRVYRTDANHDLNRVYLNTTSIGSIAVLYAQDTLIYDNITAGTVVARHGDGSWEIISPPVGGKYRFIGVDAGKDIYIARVNKEGLATVVLKGKLKEKFVEIKTLPTPLNPKQVNIAELNSPAK
jgi:hypothetical protein